MKRSITALTLGTLLAVSLTAFAAGGGTLGITAAISVIRQSRAELAAAR